MKGSRIRFIQENGLNSKHFVATKCFFYKITGTAVKAHSISCFRFYFLFDNKET